MPLFTVDTDRGTVTPQTGCFEKFFWSMLPFALAAMALAAVAKLALIGLAIAGVIAVIFIGLNMIACWLPGDGSDAKIPPGEGEP